MILEKKEAKTSTAVFISGAEMEQMNGYKFLGITISENLIIPALRLLNSFSTPNCPK